MLQVSKGAGDKSFKVAVAGKKAREFEVLTTACHAAFSLMRFS